MIRIGSLFSGIGGLELGIEAALSERGIAHHVAWQVERDPFPRSILAKHWPKADRTVEDVTLASASNLAPVDLICGGFPCQDLSYAGKGAGLQGERSGLWFEYARIVRELRPRIVVVENVAALLTRGVGDVLGELAELGYDAQWRCVRASDVGAPHRRERLFIVGWRRGSGTVADPLSGSAGVDAERAPMADGTAGVRRQPGAKRVPLCASRDGTGRSMADSIGHGWGVGLTDAELADSHVVQRSSRKPNGRGARERQGQGELERVSWTGPGTGRDGPIRSMGRNPDGVPARVDAPVIPDRWPSGPGEAQAGWEPPRTTAKEQDRAKRLKALGNAVVPAVGREVMRWAMTWIDAGGEP